MRGLFILRPEPGASATVREARELGIDAVAIPLFEVEPVAWDSPDAGGFDGLLLTSANAVRHGGEGLGKLRGLPVHAVGPATADAAREAGFDIATTGESDVERLLASIGADLRLLHPCGIHRTAFEARQTIHPIPVYRAAALPPPRLKLIERATVAVHSSRAARRLGELLDQQKVDRSTVRIAAISEAVARAAGEGWELCEAAQRPDSATLLALAARLCDISGQK